MVEPRPALGRRHLRLLESVDLSENTSSLVIAPGDCLRFLPGRREVYQAEVSGSAAKPLVAKRFLPHTKMKRDAYREWKGLLFMHEHGLPGPEPYGLACDEADGSLWVLMLEITGLRPLDQLIDHHSLLKGERERIAQQMVCAVQKLHSSGARQTDQHAANWGWDGENLYILDAGTIRYQGPSLPENARLNDLAFICLTLSPDMERDFRCELRESSPGDCTWFDAKLNRAVGRVQRARLRRYDAKTRRTCTEFEREEREGVVCIMDRSADQSLLEAFRQGPEALMEAGTLLKAGNTCTVVGVEYGGRRYVLKRYNKKPLFYRLRTCLKRSRAMRSWSSSWLLRMSFIPTPRKVAVYEGYRKGLRERCYLLMEAVEGWRLDEYVATHRNDPDKLATVASNFARIYSAMARMRAAHGDFKASNFIVDDSGELYLFDLDVFTFNLPRFIFRRRQQRDWARFMKNWAKMPEVRLIFEEAVRRESIKNAA